MSCLFFASPAQSGDFIINWGTAPFTWTAGAVGPTAFTATDQYGFQTQVRFGIARIGGVAVAGYPDDLAGMGTINTLNLVWDSNAGASIIGGATNTATMEILSGGVPFAVSGLRFQVTDIDPVDNNAASGDRCDFVTATGNNGNPALTYVSGVVASRTVRIGPGAGSGSSPALAANQAQCIFNVGVPGSPGSAGDDFGSVLATFPANTHTATIAYEESIGNVYGSPGYNASGRGVGIWGATFFTVANTISLSKSSTTTLVTAVGQVIPYTYTITNNGPLPINTGQNIYIQDSKIGTFSCGVIGTAIPSGGTYICTQNYTTVAADLASGANLGNTAIAGVGTGVQAFATRLQSNSANYSIPRAPGLTLTKVSIGGVGGFTFNGDNGWGSQTVTTTVSGTGVTGAVKYFTTSGAAASVTETIPAGYRLVSVSCTGLGAGGTYTPNLATGKVDFDAAAMAAGSNIACTFTNHRATVKVQKISNDAIGSFSFTPGNMAAIAAIPTATAGVAAPVLPSRLNVTTVGNAVTITETPAAGFGLVSASCTDANAALTGNSGSIGTLVGNQLTIPAANVVAGSDFTCVFANERATVKVQKITTSGVGGPFAFAPGNMAAIAGISTTAANTPTPAAPTPLLITALSANVTITETPAAGFFLASASCTDANSAVTGNVGSIGTLVGNQLTIPAANVKAGADFTCTFTNAKLATVKVQKISYGGTGTFTFTRTNLAAVANIVTVATGTATPVAPVTLNAVANGADITITETPPAGFGLASASCTDANGAVTGNTGAIGVLVGNQLSIPAANVVSGADFTCVFTNHRPTVKVQKISIGGTGSFSFAPGNMAAIAAIPTVSSGVVAPVSPARLNVTTVGAAVTITESMPAGYILTSASCSDANAARTGNTGSIGTLAGNALTIPNTAVVAGADFTCTFVNSYIDAVLDDFSSIPINASAGGSTASVFTNDTLEGAVFAPASVTPSLISDGGLTGAVLNADGTITVPAGTTSGTYVLTYQICSAASPASCDTATATIVVAAAPPTGSTSCTGTNLANNGGFQSPAFPGPVSNNFPATIPGWTTTDTAIEIWESGFLSVPAHTGSQFAELNAYTAGTLTQATSAIHTRAELSIFWAHRGRTGTDVASLAISDNGGGSTNYGNFSTTSAGWVVRSTTHVASATASMASLAFTAVSTGSGNISVGNFLDTVEVCQTYVTLAKTFVSKNDVNADLMDSLGDTVTYQYAIANPAGNNRSLASVAVTDDKLGVINVGTPLSGDTNTNGFLDPGETWIVQANYPVTLANIEAGSVVNIAYASGSTGFNTIRSDDATVTVPFTAAPELTITKQADPTALLGNVIVGQTITYTYLVTNSGNVTVSNVDVSDVHNGSDPDPAPLGETLTDVAPLLDSTDAASNNGIWSVLKPGDSVTFTATYQVTQTDVDMLQ